MEGKVKVKVYSMFYPSLIGFVKKDYIELYLRGKDKKSDLRNIFMGYSYSERYLLIVCLKELQLKIARKCIRSTSPKIP